MTTLILRLPDDALIRTSPADRKRMRQDAAWPIESELLSQLIEEVSILAAEHRRKKPRQVPRPDHVGRQDTPPPGRDAEGRLIESVAPAVDALKNSRRAVHVV